MWNQLTQVKIGRWLSLLFFLTVIYILQYSYLQLKSWLTDAQAVPLTSLILTGSREHISLDDVRSVLVTQQDRLNFFTLEIAQIQQQLEAMPWVYSVSIRKRWPSTLKIHVVEQEIVAVWNDRALLNRFAEIIEAEPQTLHKRYPLLYGKDESSSDVLATYMKINQLLKVNKFKIASLKSDTRHSSEIVLENGMALRLGQEQKLDRIQRFLTVYPLLQEKYDINTISYIDLRYDTGFAIGWKNKDIEVN